MQAAYLWTAPPSVMDMASKETIRVHNFGRKASGALAGQGSRLAVQAGLFVVLARGLGLESFGVYSLAAAAAALLSPFAGLGMTSVMVRNVSRNSATAPLEWTRALLVTTVGGMVVALGATAVLSGVLNGVPAFTIMLLLCADLLGSRVVESVGFLNQARTHSVRLVVGLPVALNAIRLGAAFTMALASGWSISLSEWAVANAALSIALAGLFAVAETRSSGFDWQGARLSRGHITLGLSYALGLTTQTGGPELAKLILGQSSSATSVGVFAAGSKILDMSAAPLKALASVLYPHYFREGSGGLRSAIRLSRSVAVPVVLYGAIGSVALYIGAPLAPLLLGADYSQAVAIIQILAPALFVRSLTFLAADALTGSDHHMGRTTVQVCSTAANAAFCLILVPDQQEAGAAIATLASEAILAVMLWVLIAYTLRRDPV